MAAVSVICWCGCCDTVEWWHTCTTTRVVRRTAGCRSLWVFSTQGAYTPIIFDSPAPPQGISETFSRAARSRFLKDCATAADPEQHLAAQHQIIKYYIPGAATLDGVIVARSLVCWLIVSGTRGRCLLATAWEWNWRISRISAECRAICGFLLCAGAQVKVTHPRLFRLVIDPSISFHLLMISSEPEIPDPSAARPLTLTLLKSKKHASEFSVPIHYFKLQSFQIRIYVHFLTFSFFKQRGIFYLKASLIARYLWTRNFNLTIQHEDRLV
jgi:hypothetical protein